MAEYGLLIRSIVVIGAATRYRVGMRAATASCQVPKSTPPPAADPKRDALLEVGAVLGPKTVDQIKIDAG